MEKYTQPTHTHRPSANINIKRKPMRAHDERSRSAKNAGTFDITNVNANHQKRKSNNLYFTHSPFGRAPYFFLVYSLAGERSTSVRL